MILPRFLAAAACAAFALTLPSCAGSGRIDATNPTVSDMDRLDVEWGLPPRKSRGAPKRTFQYRDERSSYSESSGAAASEAPPARETVNAPPPSAPTPPEPQLDPGRINSLR